MASLTIAKFDRPCAWSDSFGDLRNWAAYMRGKHLVVIATSPSLESVGAHVSGFLRSTLTDNSMVNVQDSNATAALDAGLRLLKARAHNKNGIIEFCHDVQPT
ncbi:hypothetical protein PG989_002058 [Apiospora arundinis]